MKQKGFTLIELLVVIAIIGILASIVLASLNQARDKARDASAVASMSSVRAQAEIEFSDGGNSYTNVCTDTEVVALLAAVDGQIPAAGAADCDVNTTGDAYSVDAQLNNGDWYCIDSTGGAGVISAGTSKDGGAGTDPSDCDPTT